jgi:small subunit ribosomal protein S16
MGATNKPFFRIVAADERTSNNGRFLETIGWYDPKKKGVNYEMNLDRIDYWKGNGARITDTVANLVKKAEKGGTTPAPVADTEKTPLTGVRKISELPAETEQTEEPPAVKEPVAEEKKEGVPEEAEDKKEVSE